MRSQTVAKIASASILLFALAPAAYAAEHIANGNISQIGPNGDPVGWKRGGYGNNVREHSVKTVNGIKYLFASVGPENGGGDVKWYFQDVPVTPGQQLVLAHKFRLQDEDSKVTVRYLVGNAYQYQTLNAIGQTADLTVYPYRRTFTVPAGATALTAWHSVDANGDAKAFVYTRDWSLTDAVPFAPAKGENLVRNADLAELVSVDQAAYWSRSGIVNLTRCGSIGESCPSGTIAIGIRGTSTRATLGSQMADLESGVGRKLEVSHIGVGSYRAQLELRLADGSKKWLNSFPMAGGTAAAPKSDTRTLSIPDNATGVRLWFFQDNSPTPAYVQGFSLVQK